MTGTTPLFTPGTEKCVTFHRRVTVTGVVEALSFPRTLQLTATAGVAGVTLTRVVLWAGGAVNTLLAAVRSVPALGALAHGYITTCSVTEAVTAATSRTVGYLTPLPRPPRVTATRLHGTVTLPVTTAVSLLAWTTSDLAL